MKNRRQKLWHLPFLGLLALAACLDKTTSVEVSGNWAMQYTILQTDCDLPTPHVLGPFQVQITQNEDRFVISTSQTGPLSLLGSIEDDDVRFSFGGEQSTTGTMPTWIPSTCAIALEWEGGGQIVGSELRGTASVYGIFGNPGCQPFNGVPCNMDGPFVLSR